MTQTAIAPRTPQEAEIRQWSAVAELTGYSMADIALIRQKQGKDPAPPHEMAMFLRAARQLGLDPLSNQVYWIRRQGKGSLQVGIDGFRLNAARSDAYAGSEPATFRGTLEVEDRGKKIIVPEIAQVIVWRIVQGRKCAFTGEARWLEFYPGDGDNGFMYRKMPFLMLAKDAECQALRKGFAAEMIGMPARATEPSLEVSEQPQPVQKALSAADYARIHGSEDESMEVAPHVDPRDVHEPEEPEDEKVPVTIEDWERVVGEAKRLKISYTALPKYATPEQIEVATTALMDAITEKVESKKRADEAAHPF